MLHRIMAFTIALLLATATFSQASVSTLPQTGQATCYNSSSIAIACTGTGQDGDLKTGVPWPSPRFVDNGNGTLTDNLTGLVWSKDANPAVTIKYWQVALDFVTSLNNQNYKGYTDWRLPNVNEIYSLYNAGQIDSVGWLKSQGFTNVTWQYWASTGNAFSTSAHWAIGMDTGIVDGSTGSGSATWLWPVRGTTTGQYLIPKTGQTISNYPHDDGDLKTGAVWPTPRFADTGECVSDQLTGLLWPKNGNIMNGTKTWSGALTSAANLTLCGYSDWRLPNNRELQSLVDYGNTNPALPSGNLFTAIQQGLYWTSTSVLLNTKYPNSALSVAFTGMPSGYNGNGYVWFNNKVNLGNVLPVRGGQTTDIIQTYTITSSVTGGNGTISCTSPVNYDTTSTCTVTSATGYQLATFTDNGIDKKSAVSNNSYNINNVTANHTITAAFIAEPPVNGTCGSANGTITQTIPTSTPASNLCGTGNATALSGTGPWYWNCGNNTIAYCSANNTAALNITINLIDINTCPQVKLYVTTTDQSGNAVTGLTAANFAVRENSLPRAPITVTSAALNEPVSVALTLDYSGSIINGQLRSGMESAAVSFINQLGSQDAAAIIKFSTTVETVKNFSSDKTQLSAAVTTSWGQAGGDTALYDSIYQAISATSLRGGRVAVIAMTDGVESGSSSKTLADVIALAVAKGVPVFTVGLGSADNTTLQNLATSTGGKYYFAPSSTDLQAIYVRIANVINNQYIITYSTTGTSLVTRTVMADLTSGGATATDSKTYSGCSVAVPTNGACGTSNGTTLSSTPTTNFCSTGTASTPTGTGPWYWMCAGTNYGTTANCSAYFGTSANNFTKSKVFMGAGGDSFIISNTGTTIYGGSGNETIKISTGVTGVKTDANIDRLELPGALATYNFLVVAGTGIQIQTTSGVVVVTIPTLNQNATIAFTDGSTSLAQTGSSTFTLGNLAISTTTAGPVAAPLNTADKSTVGTNTTNLTKAKVFLGTNDSFSVSNSGASLFGNSGNVTVKIASGVTGVKTDANFQRIEVGGYLADYKFVVIAGTGIQLQNTNGTAVLTIPSLNQDATLAFADGSASLVQTGSAAFALGGVAVSTTSAATVLATLNSADKSNVGN
jgi:VWFA-related protein